jgi:hypothetical protein
MIHINLDDFPNVSLHFSESSWSKSDYSETVNSLTIVMKMAIARNLRIKIFVIGNAHTELENPPFRFWTWVLKDLFFLRDLVANSIEKTAIFKPSNSMNGFFKFLFAMYKPKRPLKIFNNYDEAVVWLGEDEKKMLL